MSDKRISIAETRGDADWTHLELALGLRRSESVVVRGEKLPQVSLGEVPENFLVPVADHAQALLEDLLPVDLLLHRAACDQPVDHHVLLLPDPVGPGRREG